MDEEITCEEFYNQVQGELYRLDAPTELIRLSNIGQKNNITDKIESLWMDGDDPINIAFTLIDNFSALKKH